jgi:hypothetical protein
MAGFSSLLPFLQLTIFKAWPTSSGSDRKAASLSSFWNDMAR